MSGIIFDYTLLLAMYTSIPIAPEPLMLGVYLLCMYVFAEKERSNNAMNGTIPVAR